MGASLGQKFSESAVHLIDILVYHATAYMIEAHYALQEEADLLISSLFIH